MINKKLLSALFSLFIIFSGRATILSDEAKISLITIAPGEDLYSSFGHSAFWIYDPKTGFDRVYNYGTFDFNEPNFYIKFIRGKLLYRLSISEMGWLMEGARQENRGVIEQVLNLDPISKDNLFKFLEFNYLPENRAYKYDFFFDNCSTRMRDALKKVYGDRLEFDLQVEEKRSFRQLLDPFLLDKQWQDMGMDIGLGTPADRTAASYDYMYLPDFLMKGFASAVIEQGQQKLPLVKATNVLFVAEKVSHDSTSISPSLVFWIFFILVVLLTFYQYRKENRAFYFDWFLFSITGLLGFLILFLWFGTDHYVTRNNWNLIWSNPFNLVFAFLLIRKRKDKEVGKYFLLYGLLLLLLLLLWKVVPQELNFHTIPLILLLAVRALFIFYCHRSKDRLSSRTIQP